MESIRTDRIQLVQGPDEEIAVLRRIFDLYVNGHKLISEITDILNTEGVPFTGGRKWSRVTLRNILKNERYLGVIISNRRSSYLRRGINKPGSSANDRSQWIRSPRIFDPFIDLDVLAAAHKDPEIKRLRYRTDEALLAPLRLVLNEHGYITDSLLRRTNGTPRPETYRRRFGSLRIAFARIGYKQRKFSLQSAMNVHCRNIKEDTIARILEALGMEDKAAQWNGWRRIFTMKNGVRIGVAVARYTPHRREKRPRWTAVTSHKDCPDHTIVVRLDKSNNKIFDYYCLPKTEIGGYHTKIDRTDRRTSWHHKSLKSLVAYLRTSMTD
jgi:hypothetical protein